MRVAINELKSGLSRYVAQARKGEVIEITSHDKPVARLIGIPPMVDDALARLIASGAVKWNGQTPAFLEPVKVPPRPDGKTMSDIVIEDRG